MSSEEFIEIMEALKIINKKLDKLNGEDRRFITRQEIIHEHGQYWYKQAISSSWLHPIQRIGKNARISIERKEYEAYLEHLKR